MQTITAPFRIGPAFALILAFAWANGAIALAQDRDQPWFRGGESGGPEVMLYFFWTRSCPHCAEALPYIDSLSSEYPWLVVESREVSTSTENRALFTAMAASVGEEVRGVPTFFLCGRMIVGFDAPEGTGVYLEALAEACRGALAEQALLPAEPLPDIALPLLGTLDIDTMSLPVITVLLGGLDAFNPCAFFVLLFLLSLLVHARSRGRMFLIGGTFVLFSGLIYFAFMAAWLNLFLVLEGMAVITTVAGAVAVAVAAVNIKDFFAFKKGVSLSIPDRAKPRLFARMRGLVTTDKLPALLAGTVALAIAANTYELLCTSGFPLVYARILTLRELPAVSYYLYLALYNAIYVLPLLVIVSLFTATLGAGKLTEEQGRALKLLSGLMMLGLGLVLIVAPEALNNILTAVLLLVSAGALTALLHTGMRGRFRGSGG